MTDPTKSESIYKAVRRLLENNGLDRAQLVAIVASVASERIKEHLASWHGQNAIASSIAAEIREQVRKRVSEEVAAAIRAGTVTVTIGVKP